MSRLCLTLSLKYAYSYKLLAISCLIFLTASIAWAEDEEYFVEFKLDGKSLGYFLVYEKDKEYWLEKKAIEAMGLPVEADQKITFLEQYGKVDFKKRKQVLLFTPSAPELWNRKTVRDRKIDAIVVPQNRFAFKGVDYQLSLGKASGGDLTKNYWVNATGKLWFFDTDLRILSQGTPSFNMQWHNEDGKNIKDVQLGRLQDYNIDGLSVTNEPFTRSENFSLYDYTLYYPIGTRVDLYRGNTFLKTLTVDSSPYKLPIDLVYGTNEYSIVAYLPTGEIQRKSLTKTVDSYLVPSGEWRYFAAAGKAAIGNQETQNVLRVSRGINDRLTLELEQQKLDTTRIKFNGYYRINEALFASATVASDGYALKGLWHNGINVSADYSNYNSTSTLNLTAAFKFMLTPMLTYYSSSSETTDTKRMRAQVFVPLWQHFINPYVEYQNTTMLGQDESISRLGFNSLFILPWRLRLNVDYARESTNSRSQESEIRSQNSVGITKDLPGLGDLSIKLNMDKLKIDSTEIRANLYSWRYAAVNLSYTRKQDGNYSVMLGLCGSITKKGFNKNYQSPQALIDVKPFNDVNGNGIKDHGEDWIKKDMTVKVLERNKIYRNGELIDEVTPYRNYTVNVLSEPFGYSTKVKNIQVQTDRGQIATVNVPMQAIAVIDGIIPSGIDGIKVLLINKETKEIVRSTKTKLAGYWTFTVPPDLKDKVMVVFKTSPTEAQYAKH